MEILGVGPTELLFIIVIALIVLGPKEMQRAGRTIGKWLRQAVTSDGWKLFQQTSREIQTLPNRLMREAALEELKEMEQGLRQPLADTEAPGDAAPINAQAEPTLLPSPPPPKAPRGIPLGMPRWLRQVWRGLTLPARAAWRILTLPVRALGSLRKFMLTEPEEHPLGDVLAELASSTQARSLFWEQVEALRGHLLRAVLGIVAGVAIASVFTERLIQFLSMPVGGLGALRAIEVTESVGVFMKVALLAGLAVASPYVAFEFWLFAAPGLRPRERLYGMLGIPLATLFFVAGMAFTYYVLLPSAIPFLLNFLGIKAELRPQSYFSFITGLMFWIGLAFEFPLVIYLLTAIGLVKPQPLRAQWRLAILIIAIMAAAITPTVDPVNMALVMLPMSLLYFLSIGLSYVAYAGRSARVAPRSVEEGSA